jgi:exonuclease SbcC
MAFGKNGIQSMSIESSVAEIQDSANQLLGKMTDGRMNIQLKTKKQKKTDGNLTDTLDILIEDENGIRNYEMFSGGEAYRINFSVRIALSKLLANRTGAKLQFLVVDEGFGTQDFAGREYLIQAINSISDDFKKILVITHIQELKDMFPSRIEISKDHNGSKFKIVA